MTSSTTELLRVAEAVYPAGSVIAQLILLRSGTAINLTVTTNALTDTMTTAAHGMVTGSRFRIDSSGTVPGGLAAGVDYYAIGLSTTQFKAAETLADALAATAINLTDGGTGNVVINEQFVNATDPIEVLIAKELASGGAYVRQAVTTAAATFNGTEAVKPPVVLTLTNTDAVDMVYRQILVAYGASSAIGTVTGITGFDLITEAADQTTLPGQPREITLYFGAKQAA